MNASAAHQKPNGRWLVTGGGGQLGVALARLLKARGISCAAPDRGSLDVCDPRSVASAVCSLRPEVVVNCAAYTHVDGCESDIARAERTNAGAPELLAAHATAVGARLVQISTDCVFDGEATRPYREDDAPAPISVYGRTKLAGERAALAAPGALVVRTSWLFGGASSFPVKVLARARQGEKLRVVTNEVGRPTFTQDLAEGIAALVERGAAGVVHLANDGEATRYALARAVLDSCGFGDLPIEPITGFERLARVPKNSLLDLGKARSLGVALRPWSEALAAYLASPAGPKN